MPISMKPILYSLLFIAALQQSNPNPSASPNSFTYISGGSATTTTINPNPSLSSTPAPPPPASPTPPTPATNTPSSSSATIAPSPSGSSTSPNDPIPPNSFTQSNLLKNDALTTNPTSTPNLNAGYYDYNTATTAFTAYSQIGGGCNGQNSLSYVAFRQYATSFYMTPNMYFISLLQNSSPNPQQLFTAIQNIDCTWSFRTSTGLYLSLNTAFSYLTLSTSLSIGERFYLERKQDWIYVESANSYRYFLTATNGIVLVNMNQASRFVMEIWPNLNVGWN